MATAPFPQAAPTVAAVTVPPDPPSEEHLLRQHAGLVGAAVRRVWPRVRHDPRLDPEDLLQAGRIGLLKAIRSFDVAHGAKLSTLAAVVIGRHIAREIHQELRRPRPEELDMPLTEEGVDAVQDLLPDDRPGPEALLIFSDMQTQVRHALGLLEPQLREALTLCYGLDGGEPLSMRAAAERLGVTAQAVSLRTRRALEQLRMILGTEQQQAA